MAAGLALITLGAIGTAAAVTQWSTVGFGTLDPRETIRVVLVSATAIAIGTTGVFGGLFSSLLTLRSTRLHPVADHDADDELLVSP